MATTLSISNAAAASMLGDGVNQGLKGLLNNGGTPNLVIFTAAKAATIVSMPCTLLSVTNNVMTFTVTDTAATLAGTNTAAVAEIQNYAGTGEIITLTVATSGGDITLNNLSITLGDIIHVTSLTLTQPES